MVSDSQKTPDTVMDEIASLRQEVQKTRLLFEDSHLGYQSLDEQGRLLLVNRAWLQVLGYQQHEVIGHSFEDFLTPQSCEQFRENFPRFKQTGVAKGVRFEMQHKDGRTVTVEFNGRIELDGQNRFQQTHCLMQDVTLRRLAAEKLIESEKHLRSIYAAADTVAFVTTRISSRENAHIQDFSPGAEKIFGYQREEAVGQPVSILHPPEVIELYPDIHAKLLAGEKGFSGETVMLRKSGESFPGLLSLHPLIDGTGQITTCIGVAVDLSELKKAEERIRQQAETLDTITEAVIFIDMESVIQDWNRGAERMYGWRAEEAIGKTMSELTTPEYPNEGREEIANIFLKTGQYSGEVILHHRNGAPIWIFSSVTMIRDTLGNPTGAMAINWDITPQKEFEQTLRAERDRAQRYLDIAGVMLMVLDRDGKIVLINRKGAEILQDEEGKIVGADWFDNFIPEPVRDSVRAGFAQLMVGEIEPMERYENPILNSLGEERIISWHNTVLRDAEGVIVGTLSSGDDVTEQRRAEAEQKQFEEQMRHTQKLESLGILAGGIAHDFNNLLMAILGNLDLVSRELPPGLEIQESLDEAEKCAHRAADLCRQMLAYSGRGKIAIEAVDLTVLVSELAQMLKVSTDKTATVQLILDHDLPVIAADANQLRQVVMNLITNASDSLADQPGQISVTTRLQTVTQDYLAGTFIDDHLPAGEYVVLEVADTGCGMDTDTQHKLFDPFFSTKFTGRGLGMAAVLGIVRGHQGAIKIQSEQNHGTTFTVLFPVSEEQVVARPAVTADMAPKQWHGSGAVLVVDDEKPLRELGKRMLTKIGFTVETAADGQEAITLCQDQELDLVCVLLDLTMPNLSGKETFHEIRKIRPELPVVMISGYDEQEVMERFTDIMPSAVLHKPFQLDELAVVLAGILAS